MDDWIAAVNWQNQEVELSLLGRRALAVAQECHNLRIEFATYLGEPETALDAFSPSNNKRGIIVMKCENQHLETKVEAPITIDMLQTAPQLLSFFRCLHALVHPLPGHMMGTLDTHGLLLQIWRGQTLRMITRMVSVAHQAMTSKQELFEPWVSSKRVSALPRSSRIPGLAGAAGSSRSSKRTSALIKSGRTSKAHLSKRVSVGAPTDSTTGALYHVVADLLGAILLRKPGFCDSYGGRMWEDEGNPFGPEYFQLIKMFAVSNQGKLAGVESGGNKKKPAADRSSLFPDNKGSDSDDDYDFKSGIATATIAEDGEEEDGEEPPLYVSAGRLTGGHHFGGVGGGRGAPAEHLDGHAEHHHHSAGHGALDGEADKIEVQEQEVPPMIEASILQI
jgi:hypothetical protein